MPLRVTDDFESGGKRRLYVLVNEDLEEFPNGGWLPMTQKLIMQGGEITQLLRITNASTEVPSASEFALEFPTAIRLHDQARTLVYAPRKTWSLTDLPRQGTADAVPAVPRSLSTGPLMPGETTSGRPWLVRGWRVRWHLPA